MAARPRRGSHRLEPAAETDPVAVYPTRPGAIACVILSATFRNPTVLCESCRRLQTGFCFSSGGAGVGPGILCAPARDVSASTRMGTLHLLEALRRFKKPCAAIFITTDKCYENREWHHGYREEDALGGHDPYSASKAAAELIIAFVSRFLFPRSPGEDRQLPRGKCHRRRRLGEGPHRS